MPYEMKMKVLLQNSPSMFQSDDMSTITNIHGLFTDGSRNDVHVSVRGDTVTLNGTSFVTKRNHNTIGGSFWLSSIALLLYVEENKAAFAGKRVLELGSGVGLPSMYIAKTCGPASVTATDADYVTLALNVERNELQDAIHVMKLDWEDVQVTYACDTYDVLVASDCVYRDNHRAFMTAVRRLLSRNGKLVMFNAERDGLDECIYALQEVCQDVHVDEVTLCYNHEYKTKIVRVVCQA